MYNTTMLVLSYIGRDTSATLLLRQGDGNQDDFRDLDREKNRTFRDLSREVEMIQERKLHDWRGLSV